MSDPDDREPIILHMDAEYSAAPYHARLIPQRVEVTHVTHPDPVAFAEARLAEDWHRIPDADTALSLSYPGLASRMRREVIAGRRILARHRDCGFGPVAGRYCTTRSWNGAAGCRDFRDLLVRWADHPDYNPLWSPG